MNLITSALILLTYKGKILLMHKQDSVIDDVAHPWSFISGAKVTNEPFETTLTRRVRKETGIKIENPELVSENCYLARLTDDNVNQIERSENQLLNFFSLKELKSLYLSQGTAKFILNNEKLITL